MAAAGDEDDGGIRLVRDLPVGTRVLVDLDERDEEIAHLARGERSTDPRCRHGIDEGRVRQADRDTLAAWSVCGECLRARVGGDW